MTIKETTEEISKIQKRLQNLIDNKIKVDDDHVLFSLIETLVCTLIVANQTNKKTVYLADESVRLINETITQIEEEHTAAASKQDINKSWCKVFY